MLKVMFQELADVSIVHCKGRILAGDACSRLRMALLSQSHIRTLVLDLAQVEGIDAGGLGVLLGVRAQARADSVRFKLMNVPRNVEEILELTGLHRVFEFCSVQEMLCLLHRAASIESWPIHASYPAHVEDRPDPSTPAQETVTVLWSSGLTPPNPNLRR